MLPFRTSYLSISNMTQIAHSILWNRSPIEVIQELTTQETQPHPQFFRTAVKDLRPESISLGFTRISRASFYSTIRITAQVATAAISAAVAIYVGVYATTFLFAAIVGLAIVGYKLNPLLFDPLKFAEHRTLLKVDNLNKTLAKENELRQLSKKEFKERFFKPLGVSLTLKINDQTTLAEDQTICFLIPILARFEFWELQIEESEKAISILDEQHRKNSCRLNESDKIVLDENMNMDFKKTLIREKKALKELKIQHEALGTAEICDKIKSSKELIFDLVHQIKLSPSERTRLEKENLLAYYKIEHMVEDDYPYAKTNGKLLSTVRAAYLLYILKNPSSKKTLTDHGSLVIKPQAQRDAFQSLESFQAYFRRKDTGAYISKKFFLDNIENIEEITKKAFE